MLTRGNAGTPKRVSDENRRRITADETMTWEMMTRRLHRQNLAMAWQFADSLTSSQLLRLWSITVEELQGRASTPAGPSG